MFIKINIDDILTFLNNDFIEKKFHTGFSSAFELYSDTKLFMMYITHKFIIII